MWTKLMNCFVTLQISKNDDFFSLSEFVNENYTLLTAFSSNWKIDFFIFQGLLLGVELRSSEYSRLETIGESAFQRLGTNEAFQPQLGYIGNDNNAAKRRGHRFMTEGTI